MSPVQTREEYLDRLRDLLPYRDAPRILREVDGLIQDRVEIEEADGTVDRAEAERRAVAALGTPEALAEDLVAAPLNVDLDTRRAFTRMLAVLFAAHLLLAIVLTAAGGEGPALPGLLGPLPTAPFGAVLSGVLGLLLVDTGLLFLLFALLGRGRRPRQLPRVDVASVTRPRDAYAALVLLALLALVFGPFRDQVFAVRRGDVLVPFLTPELTALTPCVLGALVLFAVRPLLLVLRRREGVSGVLADGVASLALAGILVVASLRGAVVHFPEDALGAEAAGILDDLVTRAFLLAFVVASLFLVVRATKRALRVRQLLATA